MFDIMQIKTKFMRGVISKVLGMTIRSKFGYKVTVDLSDIDIRIDEENAHIHICGDVDMKVNDLKKFVSFVNEDED